MSDKHFSDYLCERVMEQCEDFVGRLQSMQTNDATRAELRQRIVTWFESRHFGFDGVSIKLGPAQDPSKQRQAMVDAVKHECFDHPMRHAYTYQQRAEAAVDRILERVIASLRQPDIDIRIDNDVRAIEAGMINVMFVPLSEIGKAWLESQYPDVWMAP